MWNFEVQKSYQETNDSNRLRVSFELINFRSY